MSIGQCFSNCGTCTTGGARNKLMINIYPSPCRKFLYNYFTVKGGGLFVVVCFPLTIMSSTRHRRKLERLAEMILVVEPDFENLSLVTEQTLKRKHRSS